jgi:hypothetical protein
LAKKNLVFGKKKNNKEKDKLKELMKENEKLKKQLEELEQSGNQENSEDLNDSFHQKLEDLEENM